MMFEASPGLVGSTVYPPGKLQKLPWNPKLEVWLENWRFGWKTGGLVAKLEVWLQNWRFGWKTGGLVGK